MRMGLDILPMPRALDRAFRPLGRNDMPRGIRLIGPLDPPRTQWDGETLELSHLCAHGEHPERLQTVLRLPLLAIARKRGHGPDAANRRIDHALEYLFAANLAALDRVGQATRKYPGEPVATLLTQAVQLQADILRKVMCGHGGRVNAARAHRA